MGNKSEQILFCFQALTFEIQQTVVIDIMRYLEIPVKYFIFSDTDVYFLNSSNKRALHWIYAVISYSVWLMNKVQDDASISWRKRKKHFFVLSNSGKPIYSRLVFINCSHKLPLIAVHISFSDCCLKQHDSFLYFLFQVWRRTQACWFFSNFASNHFLCGEWVL